MDLSLSNLFIFFKMGGPLMWPLLIAGLIGAGIAMERAIYFLTTAYSLAAFEQAAERGGDWDPGSGDSEAVADRWPAAAVRREASPWQRIVSEYQASRPMPAVTQAARMERLGAQLIEEMRRRIGVLSMIATAAPLVGLLGTIGGMMLAFQQIAASGGQADIGELADGLWVAMITTFAGLAVAIPAQLAHGYFSALVRQRIVGINGLLQLLDSAGQTSPASAAEKISSGTANKLAEAR